MYCETLFLLIACAGRRRPAQNKKIFLWLISLCLPIFYLITIYLKYISSKDNKFNVLEELILENKILLAYLVYRKLIMIFHILFPEITTPTKTGFLGETFELDQNQIKVLNNYLSNLK
jgi:hypothetical protein